MNVTFRDCEASPALEADVVRRLERLTERFGHFSRADVVISSPHKHNHKGNLFECRLELHLPGQQIVVDRHPDDHSHEDPYITVRDAFAAAERQLAKHHR